LHISNKSLLAVEEIPHNTGMDRLRGSGMGISVQKGLWNSLVTKIFVALHARATDDRRHLSHGRHASRKMDAKT
jgi:hypothetical protein